MSAEGTAKHPQHEEIAGLRAMADWLEDTPFEDWDCMLVLNLFVRTEIELEAIARKIGGCDKLVCGNYFTLRKKFGNRVMIDWNLMRDQVCERVVTGTRTVEKPIYKPQEQIGTETVTEEIVEWKCPDSLLKPAAPAN